MEENTAYTFQRSTAALSQVLRKVTMFCLNVTIKEALHRAEGTSQPASVANVTCLISINIKNTYLK
jgi:hypothetical protein